MTSELKQITNRQNAQASTGPRSAAGKARSAANALTHGLTATRVVVPGESVEEFAAFEADLIAELAPSGALECVWASQVVTTLWRLRRVPGLEAGALRAQLARAADDRSEGDEVRRAEEDDALGQAFQHLAAEGFVADKLPKYEGKLARRAERALTQLLAARSRRLAVPVRWRQRTPVAADAPPIDGPDPEDEPVVVDVSVAGNGTAPAAPSR